MSQSVETLDGGTALRDREPSRGSARYVPVRLRRMINGAMLVLGGTLIGQIAGFFFNALAAHALGPARYGVLAASVALLSLVIPLLAALQTVASREASSLAARNQFGLIRPMLRHYGLRVAACSLALAVLSASASQWISSVFHLGSPWYVVIVAAIIPCYMVGHLLGGLLQGLECFGRFAVESIVEGLTKAVIGILAMGLLWHSALAGMTTVAISSAAGLVTYLLLTIPVLSRGMIGPPTGEEAPTAAVRGCTSYRRNPRRGVPGVVGYSVTALVTYGLLALMLSSDTLIAKHYLSGHQAGLYAGISLTGKIAYFAASSFFVIAFPVFSRHHDQGVASGKWILATGGVICATAGVIVALFAVEPGWVVIPLLGGRYRAAEGYVPWMAAIFGLYALGYLMSIYLLARKSRAVIAVLVIAAIVQFAGFFAVHATVTQLMDVLALAFGVMVVLEVPLVMFGAGRDRGIRESGASARGRIPAPAPQSAPVRRPAHAVNPPVLPFPRAAWREQIVTEVAQRVGSVPVLLAGSRALGTAKASSDYDVSVVLPLLRIPWAAPRLAAASVSLSASLGAPVSVNAVPRFRMRRPGGSLFVRKLSAEALVLAAPTGWSLRRQPLTSLTTFAAGSVLVSAVRSLLEAFDTCAIRGACPPIRGHDALRKAALHVAQTRLLRSGCYASDLGRALDQLCALPPDGGNCVSGTELAAELSSGLAAANEVEGFVCLRKCILRELAVISDAPFSLSVPKSLIRNAQYAALAWLRGRKRWRVALGRRPVEAALADTQLALLRALDPGAPDGLDTEHFRLANEALPVPLSTDDRHSWEDLRDLALAEWLDAHPLVGFLA